MRDLIVAGAVLLTGLALLPFLVVTEMRVTNSLNPRIHPILDMDNQPKFKAQHPNPFYADNRAMRQPVEGTLAQNEYFENDRFLSGMIEPATPGANNEGNWIADYPEEITLSTAFVKQGGKQYEIFCAQCHGMTGSGNGIIAQRAEALAEGTWTSPPTFHSETLRNTPIGSLYNTITNGIRKMPAYGRQINPSDRWAIVSYLRALQTSQYTTLDNVPEQEKIKLEEEK